MFSTADPVWKEFRFGDATQRPRYVPPTNTRCFPLLYWTYISFFFRLSTAPISSMIGVVHFYPKWYKNDTFGCLCLGTGFIFFRPQRVGLYKNQLGVVRFTPTCRCSQYIRGASSISHAPAACLFLDPAYMFLLNSSFQTFYSNRERV